MGEAAAPVAEKIRALELMIDHALAIATQRRARHADQVFRQFVEPVVALASRDRAAESKRETLVAQVFRDHPLGAYQMMHDRVRNESHLAAARDDAREQFGIFARHRIASDHAQVLAETSEAREGV